MNGAAVLFQLIFALEFSLVETWIHQCEIVFGRKMPEEMITPDAVPLVWRVRAGMSKIQDPHNVEFDKGTVVLGELLYD